MELCLSVSRSALTLGLMLIAAATQHATGQTKPGTQPDLATRIQDGAGREVKGNSLVEIDMIAYI